MKALATVFATICMTICITWATAGVSWAQLQGSSGLPCYGNGTCDAGLSCNAEKTCVAVAEGSQGGACYGNGTCNPGLACNAQKQCAVADAGNAGGSCYGNGTCNPGLQCDVPNNICLVPGPGAAPFPPASTTPSTTAPPVPPAPGPAPPAGGAAAQLTSQESSTPPPVAVSGGRWGISAGFAMPSGDFGEGDAINNSLMVSMRVGKETITGNTGVTFGARFQGVYWSNDFEELVGQSLALMLIHGGPEVRGAYHMGNKVLFASASAGIDVSLNDLDMVDNKIGFGLGIDLGAEFITSPSSAFGVGITVHPGFTKVWSIEGVDDDGIPDVTYTGLYASFSTY